MIKTPETHPEHETVGHFFDSSNMKGEPVVYYCDSYDPSCGFWMTGITEPDKRVNISERAIDRTFHTIHKMMDGSGFSRFRPHIKKEDMPVLKIK